MLLILHTAAVECLQLKELNHINIMSFFGACIDPAHICYLMQCCNRGTVQVYLYLRTYSRIPYSATVNHLTFLSKLRKVNKWNKRGIAAREGDATRPYRYGNSHATWDHTVLPAARQRWHSRPYPSEARTRFSDLGVMQDWVDLGTTVSEQPMPKAAYHSVRRDKLPSTVRCEPGSSHTAVGRANY